MRYLLLLAMVAVVGCGGKPLETHEYLLRAPAMGSVSADADIIRLRGVQVAPYLDQDGIVLQTSDTEIHAGRQHTWAEPLHQSLVRYLQVAISRAAAVRVEVAPLTSGRSAAEVEVRVHEMHGSITGEIRLVAEWTVHAADGEGALYQFEQSLRQQDDGYPALVRGHAELLDALAGRIAESLD